MTKQSEYQMDKFPQPRTIPGGWEFSALPGCNGNGKLVASDKPASEPTETAIEKFPKTSTFPNGWDLSAHYE